MTLARHATRLAAVLLFAVSLHAQSNAVYLSANGKTYHATRECMALKRSKSVRVTTEAEAKAHGLKPCGICHREHAAKAKTTKPAANGWAKEAK